MVKKITITGGAGQIAYSILFRIAAGEIYGANQPIALHLLETPDAMKFLEGVVMELEDCAFPLLKEIKIGSDPHQIFDGVNLAILIGAKPRGPGMERKDLLAENGKIFIEQGKALNRAAKDILTLVVGNPCNTNCYIAMKNGKDVPRDRFFAMTRLDQNRSQSFLAKKAGVPVASVKDVTIWGNHSATQVPDFTHVKINGKRATEVIPDRKWLEGDFITKVQKRGAEVIAARGKSSAGSAANAAIDAAKSLLFPTDWCSMGIYSKGNPYGIDEDLIFSFPCKSHGNGKLEIIQGLEIDPFIKQKIALTEKELQDERSFV